MFWFKSVVCSLTEFGFQLATANIPVPISSDYKDLQNTYFINLWRPTQTYFISLQKLQRPISAPYVDLQRPISSAHEDLLVPISSDYTDLQTSPISAAYKVEMRK